MNEKTTTKKKKNKITKNEKPEVYLEENGRVVFEKSTNAFDLIYSRIQEELKKITKNPEKYFETSDRKAINLTIEMIKNLFSYAENDNFRIADAYIVAKIRTYFEGFLEDELVKNLSDVQKEIESLSEEKLYQIAREMQYSNYGFFNIVETFSISPLTVHQLMKNWKVSFYRDQLTFESHPTFRKKKLNEEDILFLDDWTYHNFMDLDSVGDSLSIERLASEILFSEKAVTKHLLKIGCSIENNTLLSIDPIKFKRRVSPEEYLSLRILTRTSLADIFIHHNNSSRVIHVSNLIDEDYSFLNEKLDEIEQHFHNRKNVKKDIWRDR
ncbi:MAG: hypothetical protein HZR80_16895 [Candidatus Heimdallarchaeota archaeon]